MIGCASDTDRAIPLPSDLDCQEVGFVGEECWRGG
jgi:hypothetical protein